MGIEKCVLAIIYAFALFFEGFNQKKRQALSLSRWKGMTRNNYFNQLQKKSKIPIFHIDPPRANQILKKRETKKGMVLRWSKRTPLCKAKNGLCGLFKLPSPSCKTISKTKWHY